MSNDQWTWDRSQDPSLGRPSDGPGWFHGHKLAGWGWRVAAGIVDYGPPIFVWGCIAPASTDLAWLVFVSLVLANSGYLAAKTTQSVGKRIFGMRLVQVRTNQRHEAMVTFVPVWLGMVRPLLHILDWIPCGIGFLLPALNRSKGTIADMMTHCLVFRDPFLPDPVHGIGPTQWP